MSRLGSSSRTEGEPIVSKIIAKGSRGREPAAPRDEVAQMPGPSGSGPPLRRASAAHEPRSHPAGLIDDQNAPLCDLWIGLFDLVLNGSTSVRALASWIPESYQPLAQRAVDVNPEQCLRWADEAAADWLNAVDVR